MSAEVKTLAGGKLADGNSENGRVEHDFYATNPKIVCENSDVWKRNSSND